MVLIDLYTKAEEAEDAKAQGNVAFQRKDYESAISQYTKAILVQGDGSLHVYYSNRAACHLALKDWENGLRDASQCVAVNPKFVKGHFRMVVALYELGRVPEARQCLEAARELEMAPAEAADVRRLEEAIDQAEARSGGPDDQAPLACSWDAGDMGFDMKRLGNEAFKVGMFDDAAEHYSRAIDRLDAEGLEEEVAIVRNNRAACFMQLGNHQAVVDDCTLALAVLHNNLKALTRRGLALEAMEQYRAGLEDLDIAVRLDSRNTIASKARYRLQKLVKADEDEFVLVCPDSPSAEIGMPLAQSMLGIDEITI